MNEIDLSENIKKLGTVMNALGHVQAELPAIGRDSENTFQHYHFRGIDALVAAVQPLLVKYGVLIVPNTLAVEHKMTETSKGGLFSQTFLKQGWAIYGPAGDSITAVTAGEGGDSSDKGTNKASTSAYKYLLLQLFCICDTNDDSDKGSETPVARKATVVAPKPQAASRPSPVAAPVVEDDQGPEEDDWSTDAGLVAAASIPGSSLVADEDTWLNAGYNDRAKVKALGARWDAPSKCWKVPAGADLTPFEEWID